MYPSQQNRCVADAPATNSAGQAIALIACWRLGLQAGFCRGLVQAVPRGVCVTNENSSKRLVYLYLGAPRLAPPFHYSASREL